jgi:hypothetical protein
MNREVIVEEPQDQSHGESEGEGPTDGGIDMNALLEMAAEQIAEQAREHPVRTLGVAFGVGYVLGGGLPRFVVRMGTAALIRTAGRVAIASVPWGRLIESVRGPAPAPEPARAPARAKKSTAKNGHTRAAKR